MVARRFEEECARLAELARAVETVPIKGYRFPRNMPFPRFGSLRGQERLLREAESDWTALLANAVTLEDLACNAAVACSLKGQAWQGCEAGPSGKVPSTLQGRRINARAVLRAAYAGAGNDLAPLEWVSRQRNASTHEEYVYAAVVQGAGEVVFAHEATDYARMDPADPDALTARRLVGATQELHRFVGWFVSETLRQASPSLAEILADAT